MLNHVELTGTITRAPELRTLAANGSDADAGQPTRCAQLRLHYTHGRGRAGFVTVECWNALGDDAMRKLSQGDTIEVHGALTWSEWETDDAKRSETRINAESVKLLPPRDAVQV